MEEASAHAEASVLALFAALSSLMDVGSTALAPLPPLEGKGSDIKGLLDA
jgi:hypothetical protein